MNKANSEVITYKLSQEEINNKFKNIKPTSKKDMPIMFGYMKGLAK